MRRVPCEDMRTTAVAHCMIELLLIASNYKSIWQQEDFSLSRFATSLSIIYSS